MPRRRITKILLFTFIAPLLAIGYALYLVGDSKTKRRIKHQTLLQELTDTQTIRAEENEN